MILSPPFLPDAGDLDEAAWLDAAMAPPPSDLEDTRAPEGSFPLSRGLAWHNGLHIQAPHAGGAFLPVRAIADGRIAFVRAPTPPVADVDHALNYNPWPPHDPAWTHDGFIVIAHTTEIGAAGATPTAITYFSAYMHLASLAHGPRRQAPWAVGDAVHRKDALGAPGSIYGHAGQIHFEICCDEASLRRLIGRAPEATDPLEPVTPLADGRTDSVFGSLHIHLPAGTPTRADPPVSHLRPSGGAAAPNARPDRSAPGTLRQAQWVRITYDRGSATLESRDRFGQLIGTAPAETDFEYRLYAEAQRRHDSLGSASAAPAAPPVSSPSGWYELLRFGRNLGPDPLPEAAAHWRRIVTPEGFVWADLNAPGTRKFSDADFPAVMGWHCFDDDTDPADQRCDSLRLKRLISDRDPANPHRLERDQLVARLGREDVRAHLRRAICKFPSEWDQRDVEARYGWLETVDDKSTDDDATAIRKWQRFIEHAKALSFPDLPTEFLQAQWRFHPREFIGVMRQCGWLSSYEFAQCFPRKQLHLRDTAFHESTKSWMDAFQTAQRWVMPFNQANRRYGINATKQRLAHYFSHVIPETGFLKLLKEGDNKSGTYLKAQKYWPYYGRGLIQLTWLENYKKYGIFRSMAKNQTNGLFAELGWNPDEVIARDNSVFNAGNCADSACFFVVKYPGMFAKMDAGIEQEHAIAVSRCVNGNVAIQNLNGLEARLGSLVFLQDVLLDAPAEQPFKEIRFQWRRSSQMEATGQLDAQGRPIKRYILKDIPWIMEVPLEKQRP